MMKRRVKGMYSQLPRWPLPYPHTHRLEGPGGPAAPAFGQDLFHPPGDSYLLVGGHDLAIVGCIRACSETRVDDLEWGGVSGLGGDIADDVLHLCRGEHRGEGQVAPDGDDAVEACRAAQRRFRRPHSRHPDGDARRLDWTGQELRFLDLIIRPFVAVRLAAPEPGEHLKALVEQRRQRFGVPGFAQRLEVEIAAPRAYTQDQPTR